MGSDQSPRQSSDLEGGSEVLVRAGRPGEDEWLRAIAIAAKSQWGYDIERVREWALAELSPDALRLKDVYVAEVLGQAVGWASAFLTGEVFWLDDLWIEPAWMRQGIGARLFHHVAARGAEKGALRMEWEAEPHALGFYEKLGGRYLRDSEPGIWGRINPVMGFALS